MQKKIPLFLKRFLHDNKKMYIILFSIFILGISSGALMVNSLNNAQREVLMNYLQGFFVLIGNQNIQPEQLFQTALINYSKLYLLIWLLGATIIGIPFIYLSIGVKGFLTGFSSGFIIAALGEKGILFEIIAFIPCELIIVPSLITIALTGIKFSMSIIRSKSIKGFYKFEWKRSVPLYIITGISIWLACVITSLLEAYIIPSLIRIVLPIFE
jgi:stage II sporulation protein M